jgi:RNA polymerase sigma-70 factor (ECF subfamily)
VGDGDARTEAALDVAALVARALGGDASAFEMLMRRYFRAAFAVARAHTGSERDAEDVCQIAFFRAYERLDECAQAERFAGWLLRIVRNCAINWREREAVRDAAPLEAAHQRSASVAAQPDAVLEQRELRRSLVSALATLTPMQREVIVLHDVEGWPHGAIAEMLDLSVQMSRRHLSDGRKRLRLELERERA